MKFDIWTFLFQIVNFIVLLFILKRLLFKPIREVMEKRQKTIDKALSEADDEKKEAEKLKAELRDELVSQRRLRRQAEAGMRAEVDEQRREMLEDARKDAERIIEKEKAVFEMEKKKFEDDFRDRTAESVSLYASNILKDVSDEELHRSIVRKFRGEVEHIASDISGIPHLRESLALKLITAYPLDAGDAEAIRTAFETRLGREITLSSETDTGLIAGIAVRADDRVYDFSLQGQIRTLKDALGGAGSP